MQVLVPVDFCNATRERPLMTPHVFWSFLNYLPTLSYSITTIFGAILDPLPTLISDVINGRSPMHLTWHLTDICYPLISTWMFFLNRTENADKNLHFFQNYLKYYVILTKLFTIRTKTSLKCITKAMKYSNVVLIY